MTLFTFLLWLVVARTFAPGVVRVAAAGVVGFVLVWAQIIEDGKSCRPAPSVPLFDEQRPFGWVLRDYQARRAAGLA